MSNNFYKAKIEYDGHDYFGWQIQDNTEKTIQGEINSALIKISKSDSIKTMGSGRTDAGVHALDQVVSIEIPLDIDDQALQRAMNSNLPDNIRVMKIERVDHFFNPLNSLWKEYIYIFKEKGAIAPHMRHLISPSPFNLDFDSMARASRQFLGRHDFARFRCTGSDVLTTEREIFECELQKLGHDNSLLGQLVPSYYQLRVRGSGFLKQMVRLMVGTIWSVGRGKVTIDELEEALKGLPGRHLGVVAPPQGLYLNRVEYSSLD